MRERKYSCWHNLSTPSREIPILTSIFYMHWRESNNNCVQCVTCIWSTCIFRSSVYGSSALTYSTTCCKVHVPKVQNFPHSFLSWCNAYGYGWHNDCILHTHHHNEMCPVHKIFIHWQHRRTRVQNKTDSTWKWALCQKPSWQHKKAKHSVSGYVRDCAHSFETSRYRSHPKMFKGTSTTHEAVNHSPDWDSRSILKYRSLNIKEASH